MPSSLQRHVVCVGDSITVGQVSVNYVKMLAARDLGRSIRFTNAGVNGDLTFDVLRRLDSVIDLQPDAVTVLIGTNDANASLSTANARMIARMKKLPQRPSIDSFRENLTAIVDRLRNETSARLALLSIPVLSEELGSDYIQRSTRYSTVIKEVAAARGVTYLPLHERQLAYLTATNLTPRTRLRNPLILLATAAAQHFVLRRSFDAISARRGLQLTTDFTHLNSRGATMIADLIEEFLTQ